MNIKVKSLVAMVLLSVSIAAAQTVYVSKAGHKYHAVPTCWSLARTKNPQAVSLEDAKKKGLEPCKICFKAPKAEVK